MIASSLRRRTAPSINPGLDGYGIGQPWNTPQLGKEIWDRSVYACGGLFPCRRSDAAIFEDTTTTRTIDLGKIARTINSSGCEDCSNSTSINSSNPTYNIVGRRDYAIENETLHKVGIITGHTYGDVEDTCTTVWILTWNKYCQDRIDYSSEPGDSGSPVFALSGSSATIIGVHFAYDPLAGDGVASRLSGIEYDLGQGLAVFDPGGPTVSISGPSSVMTGLFSTWTSSVSNGIDPFTYSWTGLWTSSNGSIEKVATSSGWLYLTVTDIRGRSNTYSKYITVSSGGPTPPECSE